MKKEILAGEHCPCCKRHCSLNDPHCGKGKALAAKKLKEEKKLKEDLNPEMEEWKNIRSEIRLLRLYQNSCKLLSDRKIRKHAGKEVRLSILAALAEKGGLTQMELKESSGLHSQDLEEALHKLEKKGFVSRKQAEGGGVKISLTNKGLESAREYARAWMKENDPVFSRLTEEEKSFLEHILKKITE